jgi:hypothetical protein
MALAYGTLFLGQAQLLGPKELWKSKTPNKCRFFVRLALQGRCWMVARRLKHGLQSDGTCDHLLTSCSFSRTVWFTTLRCFGLQQLTPTSDDGIANWWLRDRKRVPGLRRQAFDSLVILVARLLWIECNGRTFSLGLILSQPEQFMLLSNWSSGAGPV